MDYYYTVLASKQSKASVSVTTRTVNNLNVALNNMGKSPSERVR